MARRIEFFDGFTSATTPTIGNIVASALIDYPDDATYEATESGAPAEGNIYFNTTTKRVRYYDGTDWQAVGREVDVLANEADIADIRTTTGTADGDTDMGTYTGTLINDNESTKQNIQQLETPVEVNSAEVVAQRTTSGTSATDTDMGTYTGGIITDNVSQRAINQQLEDAIESIPSGLAFQGNWNASTNTPTLVSSTGTAGHYYNISVAGSTNLDGETDWNIGDWAVFSDTGVWQRIDNSENVTSVNSQTGAVVLDTDDISEGTNEYYTNAKADARIAAASVGDLSDVDTTTTPPALNEALAWDGSNFVPAAVSIGTSPTFQIFTSGSGTYTTPAGVSYIEVTMVGGGGGGEGSGVGDGGSGTTGGVTTFGSSFLTANGGVGAVAAVNGGAGGTASITAGAVGIALQGGMGGARADNLSATNSRSGEGGVSALGGAGGSAVSGAAGGSGIANSGSGGAGGGRNGAGQVGGGGGSGGYIDCTIAVPAASYSYAVGASGAGGAAGTTGNPAGAGGSGIIIVKEYY